MSPRQVDPLSALLAVSSRLLSTLDSPVADGGAISDMVSGLPLRQLDYIQTTTTNTVTAATTRPPSTQESIIIDDSHHTEHNETLRQPSVPDSTAVIQDSTPAVIPPINGLFPLQKNALSKFKKKTARKGVFKLTLQSVHNSL